MTNIFSQCKTCRNVKAILGKPKYSYNTHWVYSCNLNLNPDVNSRCLNYYPNSKWRDEPFNHFIKGEYKIEEFNSQSQNYISDIKTNEVKRKMQTSESEGQQKLVPFEGEIVGEIELPTIDVSDYVGKKAKIVKVEAVTGKFGACYRVETEIVGEITENVKNPIKLKGSKILPLGEDIEGRIGWGKNTKTGNFLAKMKVKKPSELVGKIVTLQKTIGKEFLTFD